MSPRRTRSPTVGPNIAAYSARGIRIGAPRRGGLSLGAWRKPRLTTRSIPSGSRSALATPSVSRLPERITLAPPISHSVTLLASPGSKRTDEPAGTLSRRPNAAARSKRSAAFVSMKW